MSDRLEVLKLSKVVPQDFCPACWPKAKRILDYAELLRQELITAAVVGEHEHAEAGPKLIKRWREVAGE